MEGTHEHETAFDAQPVRLHRSLVVFIVGLLIQAGIVGLTWQGKVQADSTGPTVHGRIAPTGNTQLTVPPPARVVIETPDVVLTDQLAADVAFVTLTVSSGVGNFMSDTNTVPWTIETLEAGAMAQLTLDTQVSPTASGGSLVNTAFLDAPGVERLSDTFEIEILPLQSIPVLSLTKIAQPDTVLAGDLLNYSLTISNTGVITATAVVLTDTLAAGTEFVTVTVTSGAAAFMSDTNTIQWTVDALAVGATAQLSLDTRVDVTSSGTLANTAMLTAAELSPITSTATTTVLPCTPDGDVNNDGIITPADVWMTLELSLDPTEDPATACARRRANVFNPDTSGVTSADSQCLLQRFLGLSSCLDEPPTADEVARASLNTVQRVFFDGIPMYLPMRPQNQQLTQQGASQPREVTVPCPESGDATLSGQVAITQEGFMLNGTLALNACNGLDGSLAFTGEATRTQETLTFMVTVNGTVAAECHVTFDPVTFNATIDSSSSTATGTVSGTVRAICGPTTATCTWQDIAITDDAALEAGCSVEPTDPAVVANDVVQTTTLVLTELSQALLDQGASSALPTATNVAPTQFQTTREVMVACPQGGTAILRATISATTIIEPIMFTLAGTVTMDACNGLNGMLMLDGQGIRTSDTIILDVDVLGTLVGGCTVTYEPFSLSFLVERATGTVTGTVNGTVEAACGERTATCAWEDVSILDPEGLMTCNNN